MADANGKSANGNGNAYWQWDRCRFGTHRVNCFPGSCSFRVYAKDGKVIREEISCVYPEYNDPEFRVPDQNPRGCQKGYQHSRAMYGADRALHPMKRTGERGSGKWERISWEQAFDEIGGKLADVIQKYGSQAIIGDHCANGVGVFRGGGDVSLTALMVLLGAVDYDLNFTTGDFNVGQYLTFGQFQHTPGIETWFLPETIFVLSNPAYANIPDVHYLLEARYRGAKVVAISPDKNPTAQFADVWLPVNWSADPALWMGVCRILIENGWIDKPFMKEQTDLPVLVRKDNGQFLRESDLREGGIKDQFYVIDAATGKPVMLPRDTLHMTCDYALEATATVTLKDGKTVEVSTVYNLLLARLADYTPEKVHEMSGIHPDQLRQVAELCRPPRKVFVYINMLPGKLYHGDLLERGFCYMLGLTGNLGKPGTGTRGWSSGPEFSCSMPALSGLPKAVLENDDPVGLTVQLTEMATEDYKSRLMMDPTMPPMEAALGAIRQNLKHNGTLSSPVALWYHHAGYKEVWDKQLDDPYSKRKTSEYIEPALDMGWWDGVMRPAPGITPRAMMVSGSNPLRRHRGGMNTFLKTLWPKLEMIVVIDPRWSTTALYADYLLPAASYYEFADSKYSTIDTRFLAFTDESVPMRGESKSDRQITLGIVRSVEQHLKKRGIKKYTVEGDKEILVDELYWRATYGNHYGESNEDEERLVSDAYRALGRGGGVSATDGGEMSIEKMREKGVAWVTGRAGWMSTVAQNTDVIAGEIVTPFRDQIERGVPYSSTTRRIEFYLDHPWFVEADEHLVRYKQPPYIGGHQPLRLTSGHLRWSIHGVWVVAEEMLKLHRGEPFAFINSTAAKEKGIADNDYIRVFNDYGSFLVKAKVSACVRPDQLVIYHAWEPYQYQNWMSYDGLLPGPPKGIQFAGGYRPYEYSLWHYSPAQCDRQTNIAFERA